MYKAYGFLFISLLANGISRLFHMHFAYPNELTAHIKSLTKQPKNQTAVMRRSRIANREPAQFPFGSRKNLYSRRLIRFAVSSTRDYDLCTTLSIVNPLSRSEDPSFTRLEEADGVSPASELEAPSVSPPRVSNQPV